MSDVPHKTQEINRLKIDEDYSFSVADQADQLINDIFAELDEILEHKDYSNNITSYETVNQVKSEESSPLSLEAEIISEIIPRKEELIQQQYFDSTAFAEEELLQETNKRLNKHFDKFLFVGSLSFLLGVIAWLINSEKIQLPIFVSQGQEIVAVENTTSSSNAEFANYLLQSLKIIDRETPIITAKSLATEKPKSEEEKPANVKSNSPTQVIEKRIYIPFYQPTPPTPSPSPTPPPSTIVKNTPTQKLAPPPAPTPVKNIPTPPPAPQPVPQSNMTFPEVEATNIPDAMGENQIESEVGEVVSSVADNPMLLGLIELNDNNRSAALFEINGVTRRIEVGENIGSSGWSLQSVANEKIVVHRNGKVRSLMVGQQL